MTDNERKDGMVEVAVVVRNESGQISIQKPDGSYFDISKYIGQSLFVLIKPKMQTDELGE